MKYIEEKLKKLNFNRITPIQESFFEDIDFKKNIVGISKTGTGKTLAYLLPVLSRIDKNLKEIQFVIIVPTNELVFQVKKMLEEIDDSFNVLSLYGSIDKDDVKRRITGNSPQIVISIPGKIKLFYAELNILKIHTAKFVCFDEADMMFDEAFMNEIDSFINAFKRAVFIMMSATINANMKPFIKKYFGSFILIDKNADVDLNIRYHQIDIKNKDRDFGLKVLINNLNPYFGLIFISKKEDQDILYKKLADENLNIVNYSSALPVRVRKKLLQEINENKYQYALVSDLASRGIDFDASVVINYDLPNNNEYFFHRSGRTGRMGKDGDVYALVNESDNRKINYYKKKGIVFKEYTIIKDTLKEVIRLKKTDEELIEAIKTIKKPEKVKPNYKKKNKQKIEKMKKEIRRKSDAKNRKSRKS